jgi:acetyltransferase-like isoleucine patch superfamily enzyme
VGPGVIITNDRYPIANNPDYVREDVFIGDNASIGAGAIILPGIRIGKNAKVAAGCLVTKDVPDNHIAAGKPCKVMSIKTKFKPEYFASINSFK